MGVDTKSSWACVLLSSSCFALHDTMDQHPQQLHTQCCTQNSSAPAGQCMPQQNAAPAAPHSSAGKLTTRSSCGCAPPPRTHTTPCHHQTPKSAAAGSKQSRSRELSVQSSNWDTRYCGDVGRGPPSRSNGRPRALHHSFSNKRLFVCQQDVVNRALCTQVELAKLLLMDECIASRRKASRRGCWRGCEQSHSSCITMILLQQLTG